MKKLHLIVQSKGGVGKSLLTYLFALSNQHKEESLFVDVDASTQTSTRQLHFLGENRIETITLLDSRQVLVRDNLITYLENLANYPFDDFFLDFGSPESEQLPSLIERDLPFKEFVDELGFEVVFHVVVAGGGAYKASVMYLQKLIAVLKNQFTIVVWQNLTSFNQSLQLSQELEKNCKALNVKLKQFGDFEPTSNLGALILDGIRKGIGINEYSIGARLRLTKELKTNFSHE